MNDIRTFAGLEQKFHGGLAEKGHTHCLIGKPVVGIPVEEILGRVGIDEKTFSAMNIPKPDGTMHLAIEPWHPEVMI